MFDASWVELIFQRVSPYVGMKWAALFQGFLAFPYQSLECLAISVKLDAKDRGLIESIIIRAQGFVGPMDQFVDVSEMSFDFIAEAFSIFGKIFNASLIAYRVEFWTE